MPGERRGCVFVSDRGVVVFILYGDVESHMSIKVKSTRMNA